MKKLAFLLSVSACCAALVGCGAAVGATNYSPVVTESVFLPQGETRRVILLAGEENCVGYAYANRLRDGDMRTDVTAEKFDEYTVGYDNVKIYYANMRKKDTPVTKSDGFVNVSVGCGTFSADTGGAFGPELGLAEYLSYAYPSETTYIIKYAACSPSSCALQWNVNGGTHYAEMIEHFSRGLKLLEKDRVDFTVSAFMFVQGESDSRYYADGYESDLTAVVDGVRTEFDRYAPDSGIAFIDAGVPLYYIGARRLNDIKKGVAESDARNYFVDTVAAGIDTELDNTDRKHYDAISQLKLGNLLGREFTGSLLFRRNVQTLAVPTDARFTAVDTLDGYELRAFCDGKAALSKWRFDESSDKSNITVDVTDGFVTAGDGIELNIALFGGKTVCVRVTADGNIAATEDGRQADPASLGIEGHVEYRGSAERLFGYRVTIKALPVDAGISFSLINANESVSTRAYTALGAAPDKPSTYMTVANGVLYAGDYAAHGAVLGNGGPFKASGGWNLADDDGSENGVAYMSECYPENQLYFRDVCSTDVYVEAKFTIDGVYNNDRYPKFGYKITTRNNNGFFYYVDAAVVGGVPVGVNLGYSTFTNGAYNGDWTMLADTVGASSLVYLEGNYIKLGLRRRGDTVTLYCNDREVLTLTDNVCRLGLSDGFVSVASFNMSMKIKDYKITDEKK